MTNYATLSDFELIRLLQASDHGAYTEIYNRFFPLLFVHAFKKLGDKDQAKDIIQEIFTKLWIRREAPLTDVNLIGYLYTLLRNRILDFFDHQRVEINYVAQFKRSSLFHNTPATDALVREKELYKFINKEIDALSPRMRTIFLMSRIDEYSYKEIAQQLDTTENNISKQINSAVKIIKTRLGIPL